MLICLTYQCPKSVQMPESYFFASGLLLDYRTELIKKLFASQLGASFTTLN